MHATEKKADYGQFSCQFDVSLKSSNSNNVFMVIQKQSANQTSKYIPIFKSECKKSSGGTIQWNTVFTDTDTLGDSVSNRVISF